MRLVLLFQRVGFIACKYVVERLDVLCVLVTLQDRAGQVLVLQEHIEVAGLLSRPLARWVCRASRDPDPPRAEMDEDQEIQIDHPP